jgi:hypothetical protein
VQDVRLFIETAPPPAQLLAAFAAVNGSVTGSLATAVGSVEQQQAPVLDVVVPTLLPATDIWTDASGMFAAMNSTLENLRALISQLPASE